MSDFSSDDKTVQRSPSPSAATGSGGGGGGSPESAMHQTRMNVTRHRRAAMRKGGGAAAPQVDIPEGGGKQLPGGVQKSMEKKLGADLSGVKIHTGGDSAGASEKLNAKAFTVGSDVHFNAGQFDPGSKEGTKLLAHELTHVVQGQRGGIQKKEDEGGDGEDGEAIEVSDPEEPAEQEADAVADEATADMGDGGAVEDGGKEAQGEEAAGGEAEAAPAEAEEAAPEVGAKLQSPISAKYSASALRKILRKKAFRSDDAPEPEADAAEAAPLAEGDGAEGKEAAPDEAAEVAPPEEGKTVAAKLKGIHRKVFRYAGEVASHHARWKEMECEKADGATTLGGIQTVLAGLDPMFAENQSVAGTMIGKLQTAMEEAQAAWAAEDAAGAPTGKPPTAAQKKANFIDARLAKVAAAAPRGIKSAINAGAVDQMGAVTKKVDVKDAFWNICKSDWTICDPEESADDTLMEDIGGVYKAFDAGDFYSKMDPKLMEVWEANGGKAKWMEGVISTAPLPIAPPGQENNPKVKPFVDGAKGPFPGTVSGFISTARALNDAAISGADKAGVLDALKLQPGRYPSPKMILAKMGAAGAGAGVAGGAKLGKPSMFYLIAFPENVYKADNRRSGETGGGQPELQTVDMPAQAFMDGLPMVKV